MGLFSKTDKSKPDKSKHNSKPEPKIEPQKLNGSHASSAAAAARNGAARQAPPQQAAPREAPAAIVAKPPLSPEQIAQNHAASQRMMLALGEMVSLLMRAEGFQNVPFGSATGLLAQALSKGQFAIARSQSKEGVTSAVAGCLWAKVSADIDAKLSRDLDKPLELAAQDWSSGEIPWVVFYVGDKRYINPMLARLQKDSLQGKPIKMRVPSESGGASTVRVLTSAELQPAAS